jgi:flagellum-specific ATP synthase
MNIQSIVHEIKKVPEIYVYGKIYSVQGLIIDVIAEPIHVSIGNYCEIIIDNSSSLPSQVIGFQDNHVLIMPLVSIDRIRPGMRVIFHDHALTIHPCLEWCGRVIDGLGRPIDHKGPLLLGDSEVKIYNSPPPAHRRQKVGNRIDVGVKAINTFLTCCEGQRMGIFAGSGVGKSVLLSMLTRFTQCDVCVIGLIGERGREVREFIEDTLGEEGLKRSVIVVATSDESAVMRRQAAHLTLAVAEYYRDQGLSVLCLMDSITRLAMAQREIGLSIGEPPTTKGYPPSVFTELAKVMERAGPGIDNGSISAFFTVLVDGDDHNEPIADAARGILDGHIVLERSIAEQGRYPAINILRSISRTVPKCHSTEENEATRKARQILSTYDDMADMIRLGAYRTGSNADVDYAIRLQPQLNQFLNQNLKEYISLQDSFSQLIEIMRSS